MAESYGGYRLPDLWKVVKDEDPESGFVHVNTLNRLRTALEQQRDNLRTHRDRLTEGWPPAQSEAATAFVAQINAMIDALEATASAAGSVCAGVDEAFAAIREARRQMESLVAEHGQRPTGAGLAIPHPGNEKADQQARSILIAADAKVVAAAGKINSGMPEYSRVGAIGDPIYSDTNGSGSQSPSSTAGRTSGASAHTALLRPPVFDPPSQSGLGSDVWDKGVSAEGPALTGGPVAGIGVTSGSGSPDLNIGGKYQQPISTPGPSAFAPIPPGIVGPDGVIRAVRPDGQQIGRSTTTPMTGAYVRPGSTGARRGQVKRGPVLASEPREFRGSSGIASGFRDRSYEEYTERRRPSRRAEGNEVWPVAEGVPPVIESPSERPHDPGPGVLGIDR